MKVSKNPDASKGYIVIAKIFLILTCIGAIANIATLIAGSGSAIDSGVNLASAALSICVYNMFISAAEAVRKDALAETK